MQLILFLLASPFLTLDEPVEVISTGAKVNLEDHLHVNRYVIFDFYADWCSPCKKWSPVVERLARQYPYRVLVKKIDVGSFGSPVAIQYGIKRLPHFVLYNPKGKRVRKGHPRGIVDLLEKKAKKLKW